MTETFIYWANYINTHPGKEKSYDGFLYAPVRHGESRFVGLNIKGNFICFTNTSFPKDSEGAKAVWHRKSGPAYIDPRTHSYFLNNSFYSSLDAFLNEKGMEKYKKYFEIKGAGKAPKVKRKFSKLDFKMFFNNQRESLLHMTPPELETLKKQLKEEVLKMHLREVTNER